LEKLIKIQIDWSNVIFGCDVMTLALPFRYLSSCKILRRANLIGSIWFSKCIYSNNVANVKDRVHPKVSNGTYYRK
jgi:hypothetical protein